MECTATGVAIEGQYANMGKVEGTTPGDMVIDDEDPSHYFGAKPGIDIEKATNGEDADDPTGPVVPVGSDVTWTYVVTNTGNVELTNVTVTDNQIGQIACPESTLAPQETMDCTASDIAMAGQYANMALVEGTTPGGMDITDEDPSHYFGDDCNIKVEKTCIVLDMPAGLECEAKIAATTLRYTGPTMNSATVVLEEWDGFQVSYDNVDLISGETILSDDGQNGYTIDASAAGARDLGPKMTVYINGVKEVIHTSCSMPYVVGQPAPLNNPDGAPSPNWTIENFMDKLGNVVTMPQPQDPRDQCEVFIRMDDHSDSDSDSDSGKDSDSDSDSDDDSGKDSDSGSDSDDDSGKDSDSGSDSDDDSGKDSDSDSGDRRHYTGYTDSHMGGKVKYMYVITNTGNVSVVEVTVEDDKLGTVSGSPIVSIDPGESVELMETALISMDTVNTVTVYGKTEFGATCEAMDTASVTVKKVMDHGDSDSDSDSDDDSGKDGDHRKRYYRDKDKSDHNKRSSYKTERTRKESRRTWKSIWR